MDALCLGHPAIRGGPDCIFFGRYAKHFGRNVEFVQKSPCNLRKKGVHSGGSKNFFLPPKNF